MSSNTPLDEPMVQPEVSHEGKGNENENNENSKPKKRKSRRKTGEPKKVAQDSVQKSSYTVILLPNGLL